MRGAADNASQQNVTANDGLATERLKRWWEGGRLKVKTQQQWGWPNKGLEVDCVRVTDSLGEICKQSEDTGGRTLRDNYSI